MNLNDKTALVTGASRGLITLSFFFALRAASAPESRLRLNINQCFYLHSSKNLRDSSANRVLSIPKGKTMSGLDRFSLRIS